MSNSSNGFDKPLKSAALGGGNSVCERNAFADTVLASTSKQRQENKQKQRQKRQSQKLRSAQCVSMQMSFACRAMCEGVRVRNFETALTFQVCVCDVKKKYFFKMFAVGQDDDKEVEDEGEKGKINCPLF